MNKLNDYIDYTKTLPEYRPFRKINGKNIPVVQVYGKDFVKLSDIKDILNSTPNTAMPKCECEGFMSVRNVLIQICGTCNGVIVQ